MNAYVSVSLFTTVFGRSLLSVVFNLILLFILTIIAYRLIAIIYIRRFSSKTKKVFLYITPLAHESVDKEKLTNFIAALSHGRTKYVGKLNVSYEICSTKDQGIRYVICCSVKKADHIKKQLKALSPNLSFRLEEDYCKKIKPSNKTKVTSLVLSSHDLLSLNTNQIDFSSNLTSAMADLKKNELVALQLLTTKSLKMAGPQDAKRRKLKLPPALRLVKFIVSSCVKVIKKVAIRPAYYLLAGLNFKNVSKDLLEKTENKTNFNLYKTDIRLLVSSSSNTRNKELIKEILSALSLYANSNQSIREHVNLLSFNTSYVNRSPSFFSSSHLSSQEIAGLYNFGYNETNHKGDQEKILSRILPVPIGLRARKQNEINIGVNNFMNEESLIGLNHDERMRHIYISGGTGSGKTTLVKYMAQQDIKSGKGVAIIDPHGDMAEELLELIPENRKKDVIYFNPRDITNPISINLLELDDNLTGSEKLLEQDLITEQLISIFRKLFSKDGSGGHRLENILRSAVATAFYTDNPTIFTIYKILVDYKYRRSILNRVDDPALVSFWNDEYDSAGSMQRVKLSIGITSKISRFLRSVVTKKVLERPRSTISFDDLINNKKILICNLSKGLIGEDNSQLLGSIIMAKLQLAAYKRAEIKPEDRQDFYIYVDEFQNFATSSFLQLLSESRKYRLLLTLAEQSPSQQDISYINNILANVGTIITFRTNSPNDERILLPLLEPYIPRGEIMNLPAYNFYLKISAVQVFEPTSGTTIRL